MCLNKSMVNAKAFPLNAKNTNEFLPISPENLKEINWKLCIL